MRKITNSIGYYTEFIINLFVNEYKIQYKNLFSGLIWIFVFPLLTISSLYFLLSFFTKLNIQHYNLLFLSGFIPWQFFVNSLTDTVSSIKKNASIVKKINFPYIVIPLPPLLFNFISFIISLLFFLLLLHINGITLTLFSWFLLLLSIVVLVITVLGFSLTLSSLAVFIKELPHILTVSLSIIFYLSPILYPVSFIPDKFLKIYLVNPLASIIVLFRGGCFNEKALSTNVLFYAIFFSISVLLIGIKYFNYKKQYFADCVYE